MTARSNVDRQEIAKFEALAARWWDMDGDFRPLHEINPLRANFIDGLSPVADRDLVDVGCGGGILAEAMAQRGARVTGIDMGEAPLSVARLHQLESGLDIDYRQATAEELAEERPGSYDVVCCLEMLEHIVTEAPGHLRPYGWLLLEHGFDQGEEVRTLLTERGFSNVATRADWSGQPRVSGGQWQN